MPCYNEEKIIASVIMDLYKDIITHIPGSELLVVDDCSTDNTYAILLLLQDTIPELRIIKTVVNSGHGPAIQYGYENADKEWIFQVDSDGQFDTQDFWKLYERRNEYKFISGYRQQRHDPLYRILLSRIIRFFILLVFGTSIADANCPYRLMRRDVLKQLLHHIPSYALAPNIMLSILSRKMNVSFYTVPIKHYSRASGSSTLINFKLLTFAFKGMLQLVRFRFYLFTK
jgi:glycosyltransferase involved in cell wall biosynthesis